MGTSKNLLLLDKLIEPAANSGLAALLAQLLKENPADFRAAHFITYFS